MARRKLTVSLTEETLKTLDVRAEKMGLSRSALIEVALRRILADVPDVFTANESAPPPPAS